MARLLVVEDNRVNLDLMTYLLTSFGHDVVAVDNGHAALELLRQSRFDLVVCDVQMPGMDGLQLLRELRTDAATAQLTVVAVTAAAMVGDRERLLAAGFDGYLAKPIDPQSFVHHIGEFIARPRAVTASRS